MKKIVAVIPARYASSRFPGKPLADICGKPVIWWVYQQCKKVQEFDSVYVATDDNRIENVCKSYEIPVIMTSDLHQTHIHRIHEVSNHIEARFYVVVCGDEPLIKAETIRAVIPTAKEVQIDENMQGGGSKKYMSEGYADIFMNHLKF